MPRIAPGDVFFDKLDDTHYEKCVLQPTDGSESDRHAAARGGTGEFYRVATKEEIQSDAHLEVIFDFPGERGGRPFPKMVFLARMPSDWRPAVV